MPGCEPVGVGGVSGGRGPPVWVGGGVEHPHGYGHKPQPGRSVDSLPQGRAVSLTRRRSSVVPSRTTPRLSLTVRVDHATIRKVTK